ncbi:DUF341 domain protein [Metarhizium acridum CQMa 102]|uniref:DUF341 domain protein n=2 Tax=Metarhizium acridum TaxID=92637 RepID=E9DUB8_METAQ|nr:DUF341 domain protein [Metarhizium acridum CQMa 102]EFY92580.1 DUF341 domain protein [Metarhizium acridum CQMa 102]
MRFLCLHGLGANSHVLETQFSAIRYEMDRHHTFHFVEGTELVPAAAAADSVSRALVQLHKYLAEEGPFDGAIGFSQGAALIAMYLLQCSQDRPNQPLPFQCAIFFSASRPFDTAALKDGIVQWAEEPTGTDGPRLNLPTAHIWGSKDVEYRGQCKVLSGMCDEARRYTFVHGGGHEIPGPRAKEDMHGCVRVIRRIIERASVEA